MLPPTLGLALVNSYSSKPGLTDPTLISETSASPLHSLNEHKATKPSTELKHSHGSLLIVITGVHIHSYSQAEFHKARLRARPPVGASGAGLRQGVVGLGDRL